MDDLKRTLAEKFRAKSELAKQLMDCFDSKTIQEAVDLAVDLAQLGINYDASTPFAEHLDLDTLLQLQKTFCEIADTTISDEFKQTECDKKLVDSFVKQLETLKLSKEQLELSSDEQKTKRENIAKFNRDKAELSQKLKKQSCADKMEKMYAEGEKLKNEQYKKRIKALEEELAGFDFDLTNEVLEKKIAELDKKYKKTMMDSMIPI